MLLTHLWPWNKRSTDYKHVKFEGPRLQSAQEKANIKVLVK